MIKQLHLNECDSTQDVLKEQLAQSPSVITHLVSCNTQTQGRGRGGKTWKAMPGTLCFSFSLKPHPELSFTALEVSLLIVKFFETKNQKLKLKWPNDLWTDDRKKCAGILVQGSKDLFLAGVGLNLYSDDPEYGGIFPQEFSYNPKELSLEIVEFIEKNRFTNFESLIQEWEERCGHLRSEVSITEGSDVTRGLFVGLGSHGEALIQTGSEIKKMYNGSLRLI